MTKENEIYSIKLTRMYIFITQMQDYRIYLQTPHDNTSNDLAKMKLFTAQPMKENEATVTQMHTHTHARPHSQK